MDPELFLVDAYSQIFRGFFAIRSLTDRRGNPTNALYAIAKLLLKLDRDYPGEAGAIVFDCGRVRFRQELNALYKANRPPMPEELKSQIPAIRDMMAAFGWPLLECPEYEADDLIAAIACHHPGRVQILSSDKDIAQSINDRVSMLIPDKGGTFLIRDVDRVREKFGVGPERIIDFLALTGDSADNIEGVSGVGPKGAAALIGEAGSIEEMLAHPEKISSERLRSRIVEAADLLRRNVKLIRLRTDLPENMRDLPALCRRKAPDFAGIRELCRHADFNSILKDLPQEKEKISPVEQGELF